MLTHWSCVFTFLLISCNSIIQEAGAQFISHFNSRGIRGNVSIDLFEEDGVKLLLVEWNLETQLNLSSTSLETDAIQFEWSIHERCLTGFTWPPSCSDDDIGPSIDSSSPIHILTSEPILLGRTTRKVLPLNSILPPGSPPFSSFIWGRSVRIKLSRIYSPPTSAPSLIPASETRLVLPKPKDIVTSKNVSIIRKPSSPPVRPIAIPHGPKPTFKPRARPPSLVKPKTTSPLPSLPKPLALMFESEPAQMVTNETSSNATTTPNPTKESSTTSASIIIINSSVTPSQNVSSSTLTTTFTSTLTTIPSESQKRADEARIKLAQRLQRLFGRSVVCGNIIDTREVKTVEASFQSEVAGRIILRGNEDDVTLIMPALYHVKSKVTTRHDWRILASDILDTRQREGQCKFLEIIFDPNNSDGSNCDTENHSECRMGDLGAKHGQIQIAGQGKNTRTTMVDFNLPLSALQSSRSLYVAIYESGQQSKGRPNILTCAELQFVKGRKLEASINMDGVRGFIKMSQRHPMEPTSISYDLFGLEGNTRYLSIYELPVPRRTSTRNNELCSSLGELYNPTGLPAIVASGSSSATAAATSIGTADTIRVGNLSSKFGQLAVIDSEYEDHYLGENLDLSIQLYGRNSVVGRSIVVHKNNREPWVCGTLNHEEEVTVVAAATFYYPVVGRIWFEQLAENEHSETGVLIELYNPNGERDSLDHNWLVHVNPAMADFYNWSERCGSAGQIFDPIEMAAGLSLDQYSRQCIGSAKDEIPKCRAGDVSLKSGFKLTLPVSPMNRTRLFYTDPYLPLQKSNGIIGRSVVIYDESAPKQRGNRLACATIKRVHSLKASVKSWDSGPSIPSAVSGLVSFEQEAAGRTTKITVDLNGLNGNVENYAIHNVWTMQDKEFPCSNDSLYDVFDPFDSENSFHLPPSAHFGSLTTVDRVRVGDISKKHGSLEGLHTVQKAHVDANVPLYAPKSIIGRSMVLRAAVNDFRWVCGTIELDYDRGYSREIIAIASFDEPRSKVAGYVRFRQLEHKDGSLSDTFVQVDLRLQSDGVHEPPTSDDHNWAIFVNQVGEDAFIEAEGVRCIAAGFKWNPYLAQDSLETYPSSCGHTEQLTCAMGDLGMRHGNLKLGPNNRQVISDSNLPLTGNYTVMGRSLVIFNNKKRDLKLACANIMPDIHLRSNFVIKRIPSFTVARFIEEMRSLLGATEWLMVPELRATKAVANGECVQMTIHFYGQRAHQMQVELNNLITMGTVRRSTRSGAEKISTHYKQCRTGEPKLTSSASIVGPMMSICALMISLVTATRLN